MSDARNDADRVEGGRSAAGATSGDERSIGQIVSDVIEDVRDLFRDEVALAKAEFNQALKKILAGVVMLVIGAVLANTGLNALIASVILGLSEVWEPWLAALVVGLVIIVVGGILALAGMRAFRGAELTPDRTVRTLKDDVQAVKEGLQ